MTLVQDIEPHAILVNRTVEGITTIGINRPSKKNAIDQPAAKKLRKAFVEFEKDKSQKVCVFYGTGGNFSTGFDLSELSKWNTPQPPQTGETAKTAETAPADGLTGVTTYGGRTTTSITRSHFQPVNGQNEGPLGPSRMQIKKPVICAVTGNTVAGGTELSLFADIRVMEDDAIFGIFSRRLGVPLLDGGTVRLQAIIGVGRALDILLTGRAVGAKEALDIGLANRVVPKGEAFNEAMKIARLILTFPQECVNVDRASCYYSAYEARSFEDALSNEFEQAVRVGDLAIKKAMMFAQRKTRHANL